jgi:hypothetical protein
MLNSSHLLELTLHNPSLFSQHHKILVIKRGFSLIHILLGGFYSVHRHVTTTEQREPQNYELKLLVISSEEHDFPLLQNLLQK